MLDDEVQVGDVYRVGGVLIEVTQARIPCYKLAIKMGIEGFQNQFMKSGRAGFYCRVLEEGVVGAGDLIKRVSRDPQGLSVRKVNDLLFFDPESKRAVVLLSAGVGLTPMISMLRTIVQRDTGQAIHGTRNSREHAMGEHVRRVVDANANVHAHICYSKPASADAPGSDYDSSGRVNSSLLKQVLPFDDYEFYLCGPAPFMKSLNCELLSLGVSESRIHYEFFGPASALTEPIAASGPAVGKTGEQELNSDISVVFAQSDVTVTWDPACESILELAENHGLSPDYSCRSGICHTCVCKLVEGQVEYPEEPLDSPSAGEVLICCAVPKRPLVIDS